MPFFVLMQQSFFHTDSQCSSVQLLDGKNAVQPLLYPKGDLPLTTQPLGSLLFQQTPLCLPQMPFRISYSWLALITGKMFPRTQAATICSLLQEVFPSCRRLNWTVWAGNIPLSCGLPPRPTAFPEREDNLFQNSSQEVEVICNQLKWMLPITEF